jgi:hypothetical protein
LRRDRPLTSAEVQICQRVFGETLNPAPVRVKQQRWWPLQPRNIVMAPDGHLYFPPGCRSYCDDFAVMPIQLQAFFLHEMTHIWQYQTGANLILARGLFARYRYLPLIPGKAFELYGIEQQAEIVRDYWLLCHDVAVPGASSLGQYQKLLPFLPLAPAESGEYFNRPLS